jgi:hypothetical protein
VAKVRGVCKIFNEAGKNVASIRYVCREVDHEKARRKKTIASTPSQSDKAEASERDLDENIPEDVTTQRDAEVSEIDDKEYDSHDGKLPEIGNEDIPGKSRDGIPGFKSIGKLVEGSQQELLFRQVVEQDLRTKPRIHQLRIEMEPKLLYKSVGADEREHSDFWLSDPDHLHIWVPSVAQTLQHLCIVDYGYQAMFRVSPILKILSHYCKFLHLLPLYSF